MDEDKIFQKIARACEGLVYISETDAPIRAFLIEQITDEAHKRILSGAASEADEAVEEINFDIFFERLTAEKSWHGEIEKTLVKKFRVLKRVLEENLSDLRVLKIGRVRKEIFVIGFDKDRRLAGVRTQSVET